MPCAPTPGPSEPDQTEEQTLKADPFAQLKLLDLQELDSRIARLRHQLQALPEHERIAALEAERRQVTDQARDAAVLVDDLTREQKKADADVEQVKARRERDQSRMDAGLISNPKDLERMSHELQSLERRISDLEDVELEVMERLETAQATSDELTGRVETIQGELDQQHESRSTKSGELDVEVADVTTQRATMAEGLPTDLLALYDKLRDSKQGVGAAELRARQCGGCRLTLNAADLAVIRKAPVDEVVRCEECSRILVRTSESGL